MQPPSAKLFSQQSVFILKTCHFCVAICKHGSNRLNVKFRVFQLFFFRGISPKSYHLVCYIFIFQYDQFGKGIKSDAVQYSTEFIPMFLGEICIFFFSLKNALFQIECPNLISLDAYCGSYTSTNGEKPAHKNTVRRKHFYSISTGQPQNAQCSRVCYLQ